MDKKKLLITGYYVKTYPRNKVLIESLNSTFNGTEHNFRGQGVFAFRKNISSLIKNKDYIFIVTSSYKTAFLALYLGLFTRKKVIYDAFISFYDTFVTDRKRFYRWGPRAIIAYLLDLLICWSASILIFDTKVHQDFFVKKFLLPKQKKKLVWPVSLDLELIDRPRSIFLEGKFNIFFYGTYIPLQGVRYIIEAASKLQDNPDINFILLGDGQERQKIERLAKYWNLNNVTFLEPVNYEQLMQYIKKADVCLGIFGNSDKAQRVIPNKVLECLANGKLVITGKNTALAEYFTDKHEIIYCPMANSRELANKIAHVYKHYHELTGLGKVAREKVEKYFSQESLRDLISSDLET